MGADLTLIELMTAARDVAGRLHARACHEVNGKSVSTVIPPARSGVRRGAPVSMWLTLHVPEHRNKKAPPPLQLQARPHPAIRSAKQSFPACPTNEQGRAGVAELGFRVTGHKILLRWR